MQQEITDIEIDWTEAVGPSSSVGSPYLFGWLRATYMRPGCIEDGRVIVIARDNQSMVWTHYQGPVSLVEADTLVSAFAVLGVAERAPRVENIPDSSDTWFKCTVRGSFGGRAQSFTLQTQRNGFRGQDADGLRAVFQRVIHLSGCGYQHTMFRDMGDVKG